MSTKRPCRLRERINIERFRGLDLGKRLPFPIISRLICSANSAALRLIIVRRNAEVREAHRDILKGIPGSLQLADPCEAVSWPRPALAPGR